MSFKHYQKHMLLFINFSKQKKMFKVLLYPSLTPEINFSMFTNDIFKNVRPFQQLSFQKRVKEVEKQSEKKRHMNIYRPRRANHMRCDICRIEVQDEFQHAQTQQHILKISKSVGTEWINELCKQYDSFIKQQQSRTKGRQNKKGQKKKKQKQEVKEKQQKKQKLQKYLLKNCVSQTQFKKVGRPKQCSLKKQNLNQKKLRKEELIKHCQYKSLNVNIFQGKDISQGILDLFKDMKSLNTGFPEIKRISRSKQDPKKNKDKPYHGVILKPIREQF